MARLPVGIQPSSSGSDREVSGCRVQSGWQPAARPSHFLVMYARIEASGRRGPRPPSCV